MSTINMVAELTVDDALEATQIVEKHRLPPDEQLRVRELLLRNREMTLTEAEERELDLYMVKMDEALGETAEELLEFTAERQNSVSV